MPAHLSCGQTPPSPDAPSTCHVTAAAGTDSSMAHGHAAPRSSPLAATHGVRRHRARLVHRAPRPARQRSPGPALCRSVGCKRRTLLRARSGRAAVRRSALVGPPAAGGPLVARARAGRAVRRVARGARRRLGRRAQCTRERVRRHRLPRHRGRRPSEPPRRSAGGVRGARSGGRRRETVERLTAGAGAVFAVAGAGHVHRLRCRGARPAPRDTGCGRSRPPAIAGAAAPNGRCAVAVSSAGDGGGSDARGAARRPRRVRADGGALRACDGGVVRRRDGARRAAIVPGRGERRVCGRQSGRHGRRRRRRRIHRRHGGFRWGVSACSGGDVAGRGRETERGVVSARGGVSRVCGAAGAGCPLQQGGGGGGARGERRSNCGGRRAAVGPLRRRRAVRRGRVAGMVRAAGETDARAAGGRGGERDGGGERGGGGERYFGRGWQWHDGRRRGGRRWQGGGGGGGGGTASEGRRPARGGHDGPLAMERPVPHAVRRVARGRRLRCRCGGGGGAAGAAAGAWLRGVMRAVGAAPGDVGRATHGMAHGATHAGIALLTRGRSRLCGPKPPPSAHAASSLVA